MQYVIEFHTGQFALHAQVNYLQSSFILNITDSYWLPGIQMRWSYPRQRQVC